MFVAKLTSDGNLEWFKMFTGSGSEQLIRLLKQDDGGVLAMGNTDSYGEGSFDAVLLKLSASGEVLVSRLYGSSNYELTYDIAKVQSGGYALSGVSVGYGAGLGDFLLYTLQ